MTDAPKPAEAQTVKPVALPDPKKLDEAANRINTEYEAILKYDQSMKQTCESIVNRAIALGDMLLTVKLAVGHGNWLPWLKTNCPNVPREASDIDFASGPFELLQRFPPIKPVKPYQTYQTYQNNIIDI